MALKNAGGMWLRDGKKGKFLSGKFQPEGRDGVSYSFMAFKNKDKVPGGKQPDYKIVMTQDDDKEAPLRGREPGYDADDDVGF